MYKWTKCHTTAKKMAVVLEKKGYTKREAWELVDVLFRNGDIDPYTGKKIDYKPIVDRVLSKRDWLEQCEQMA